jgi:hypothetical protein
MFSLRLPYPRREKKQNISKYYVGKRKEKKNFLSRLVQLVTNLAVFTIFYIFSHDTESSDVSLGSLAPRTFFIGVHTMTATSAT